MNSPQQNRNAPLPTLPVQKLESSASTCLVGCKLPHGLKLELKDGEGRIITHVIKGMNDARIVGGHGLTHGIPTDFMQQWMTVNKDHPAVKQSLIFMHTDVVSIESMAKERRAERSGLEAIDPLKDARKHGLNMDPEAEAAYRQQMAENPMRNRQVQD